MLYNNNCSICRLNSSHSRIFNTNSEWRLKSTDLDFLDLTILDCPYDNIFGGIALRAFCRTENNAQIFDDYNTLGDVIKFSNCGDVYTRNGTDGHYFFSVE